MEENMVNYMANTNMTEFIEDFRKLMKGRFGVDVKVKVKSNIPITQLVSYICDCLGCKIDDLVSRRRNNDLRTYRQMAQGLCILYGHEPQKVANYFGFDRTTILHSVEVNEQRVRENPYWRDKFKELITLIDKNERHFYPAN